MSAQLGMTVQGSWKRSQCFAMVRASSAVVSNLIDSLATGSPNAWSAQLATPPTVDVPEHPAMR